jgi:hypothetical protein
MSLFVALSVIGLCLAANDVPSVPLHNAALPGMKMPIIGIGTGGYGNASGWGGEYWNNT